MYIYTCLCIYKCVCVYTKNVLEYVTGCGQVVNSGCLRTESKNSVVVQSTGLAVSQSQPGTGVLRISADCQHILGSQS